MNRSAELLFRSGLIASDAPCGDLSLVVVLPAHGAACHPAKHCNLTNVGQRISYGPLEEPLRRDCQRPIGREQIIETLQRPMKPLRLYLPREGFGVLPFLVTEGDGKSPIKQVT